MSESQRIVTKFLSLGANSFMYRSEYGFKDIKIFYFGIFFIPFINFSLCFPRWLQKKEIERKKKMLISQWSSELENEDKYIYFI